LTGIDWVIYGGESGPRFREDDPNWAAQIAVRCRDAGAAFFYKQDAGRLPGKDAAMNGTIINRFPVPRQIPWPTAIHIEEPPANCQQNKLKVSGPPHSGMPQERKVRS
jgi:hypothetical protein